MCIRDSFSYCTKNGERQSVCSWNDVTQAEAYAHTLQAFFAAYPEFKENEFFLAGESYAGQYIPNIANHLLTAKPTGVPALKGIAVGNGCWGGDAHSVDCNGPNAEQNDLDMFFGKGMISKPAYDAAYADCKFPSVAGIKCQAALDVALNEVGPHNVYNVYDNCPDSQAWFETSGKSPRWLRNYLRDQLSAGRSTAE